MTKAFLSIILAIFIASASCGVFKIESLGIQATGDPLWFDKQRIDHFNQQDERTWSQRYWIEDEFFKPHSKGPIFLYICGESTCRGAPGNKSFAYQMANKTGALLVALEHRYYGKSQPFGKDSMKTTNLRFLTVENALEDLATFIMWFKEKSPYGITEDNKWITIGGSYPGALSAWFRAKYPHLTAGAWSSSGVVNAIADYEKYDYHVHVATSRSSPECPKMIQKLNEYYETQLFSNATYKLRWGQEADKLTNDEILYLIADYWAGFVQSGTRVALCEELKNATNFQELADITIEKMVNASSIKSYGVYYVRNETLTEKNDDDLGRQWLYQTCTQMGWFQTANNNSAYATRSKKLDINHFKQFCKDVFGLPLFPKTNLFNGVYGGTGLQATNIALMQGAEDPWQWAGKNHSTGSMTAVYVNCDRCSHCIDLKAANESDPNYSPAQKQAHQKIENLILGYLGQHQNTKISA